MIGYWALPQEIPGHDLGTTKKTNSKYETKYNSGSDIPYASWRRSKPKKRPLLAFSLNLTLISSSISSSDIWPPYVYHTTVIIPSTAVNTHLKIHLVSINLITRKKRKMFTQTLHQLLPRSSPNSGGTVQQSDPGGRWPKPVQPHFQKQVFQEPDSYLSPAVVSGFGALRRSLVLRLIAWLGLLPNAIQCDLE
jgi:hypothetical protein